MTIQLWDATTGNPTGTLSEGHTDANIRSFSYSPDGTRIVSGSIDGTLCLWDTNTCTSISNLMTGHTKAVTSVSFSPDGTRIISGSADHSVRIWDTSTCAPIGDPLDENPSGISFVAFLPLGGWIVSGSQDGQVRVWDLNTTIITEPASDHHTNAVTSVAFSSDGSRIATGSRDTTLRLWDVKTGTNFGNPWTGDHNSGVTSVSFSPDASRVVSGSEGGALCLRDMRTSEFQRVGALPSESTAAVDSVAFLPDSARFISSTDCGGPYLVCWDTKDENIRSIWSKGLGGFYRVAFSSDGTRIVSVGYECVISMWDSYSGKRIGASWHWQAHGGFVDAITVSLDGEHVVISSECALRLFGVKSGSAVGLEFGELWRGRRGRWDRHNDKIGSVAFSPDGRKVASGSSRGTVCLWDPKTGECFAQMSIRHINNINSVVFSPDGMRIASASDDGTVRIWDVTQWVTAEATGDGLDSLNVSSSHAGEPISVIPKTTSHQQYPPELFSQGPYKLDDDGWITGPNGELIIWIPGVHRLGLSFLDSRSVGAPRPTELDFSKCVMGERWAECYEEPPAS